MGKDPAADNEAETVKVLLDLLRRVDKEVTATLELSPEAKKAVETYKHIADQLAPGRLHAEEYFRVRQAWTPPTGQRTT